MSIRIDPNCPPNTIYLINDDYMMKFPKRRDGKPDMRYGINKMQKIFEDIGGVTSATRGRKS